MRKLLCLRCQTTMVLADTEKLQLGQMGWFLGNLPNLVAGALEVEIYFCPQCGKVEFFLPQPEEDGNRIAKKCCPQCGHSHDWDDPKCPICKHNYYER